VTTQRILCNVLTDDVQRARRTYTELFGLEVAFDSDWFVQLTTPDGAELGLLRRDHPTVPAAYRQQPAGIVLTFVVAAVEPVLDRARRLGLEVVAEPHATEYGQRRVLLRDPDGTLVDVSAPVAPLASEYR
jgi:catechol 2,3-dioxygenase-like lactoylglutathione lyase family enzyme